MLKTNFKSVAIPAAIVGFCVSFLVSAQSVRERPQPRAWIEVQGVSFRTDSVVALQAHETREDNSLILTDGGWEFEVPITYSRLKEQFGQ
jgi:hypothetical protein